MSNNIQVNIGFVKSWHPSECESTEFPENCPGIYAKMFSLFTKQMWPATKYEVAFHEFDAEQMGTALEPTNVSTVYGQIFNGMLDTQVMSRAITESRLKSFAMTQTMHAFSIAFYYSNKWDAQASFTGLHYSLADFFHIFAFMDWRLWLLFSVNVILLKISNWAVEKNSLKFLKANIVMLSWLALTNSVLLVKLYRANLTAKRTVPSPKPPRFKSLDHFAKQIAESNIQLGLLYSNDYIFNEIYSSNKGPLSKLHHVLIKNPPLQLNGTPQEICRALQDNSDLVVVTYTVDMHANCDMSCLVVDNIISFPPMWEVYMFRKDYPRLEDASSFSKITGAYKYQLLQRMKPLIGNCEGPVVRRRKLKFDMFLGAFVGWIIGCTAAGFFLVLELRAH